MKKNPNILSNMTSSSKNNVSTGNPTESKSGSTKTLANLDTASQPILKFSPPYLRFKINSEFELIREKMKQSQKLLAEQRAKDFATTKENIIKNTKGKIFDSPQILKDNFSPQITTKNTPLSDGIVSTNIESQTVAQDAITKRLNSVSKFALDKSYNESNTSEQLTVNPNGNIQMGWWCSTTFRLYNTLNNGEMYDWYLITYENNEEVFHYITSTSGNKHKTIDVVLNGDTYGLSAYASQNQNKAKIKFVCFISDFWGGPIAALFSNEITLEFVHQQCLELYSLVPSNFEFEGGNHGNDPKVRVNLSGKAQPGGQIIFLSTTKPNKGWINSGWDNFTIPQGENSIEIEGFLGTANVHKSHDFHVVFSMGGKEGYVNIKINK